jgi:hypothetical protein
MEAINQLFNSKAHSQLKRSFDSKNPLQLFPNFNHISQRRFKSPAKLLVGHLPGCLKNADSFKFVFSSINNLHVANEAFFLFFL